MKHLDYLLVRIAVFVAAFVGLSYCINSLWLSLLVALIITFVLSLIIDAITGKRSARGYNNYLNALIIGGNDKVFSEVRAITHVEGEIKDNYMITNGNEMILNGIKYSLVSPDEILKNYRIAKSMDIKTIYILARAIDRKSASIMNYLDINYTHISVKYLYRHSNKSECVAIAKRSRTKIRQVFAFILARANAKRFLITSTLLMFLSIFTPLKAYYLTLGGLTFLLAILCLSPLGENTYKGKKGIFELRNTDADMHDNNKLD